MILYNITQLRPVKYRCRTAIISEILQSAMGGATVSKLVSGSYVPFSRIGGYLLHLQENQLLTYNQKTLRYKITEQGMRFLHMYEEMNELFLPKAKLHEETVPSLVS